MTKILDVCKQAMAEGLKIDLKGCSYGETTGCCPFIHRPTNYYHFLAGFIRTQRMKDILEIGTHFGGSIMSMSRGLSERHIPESTLVTVDIISKNEDGFKAYPRVKRVRGDSLSEKAVAEATGCFKGPIDLLYIDSVHEYEHTRNNMDIYGEKLDPKYVILDDIRQCASMRELWKDVVKKFGEMAFDASEISIRKGAGFGVIKWRR